MELWTPGQATDVVEAKPVTVMHQPDIGKVEGGSYFDDEMDTAAQHREQLVDNITSLIEHLQQRPDHTVYVASEEQRGKMREVFNWWKRNGWISHNPNIRIDYGVAEGGIRIDA